MDEDLPARALRACMGSVSLALLLAALCTLLSLVTGEHWRRTFALLAGVNLGLALFLLLSALALRRRQEGPHR